MASTALDWALNNGMTQAEFDQRIFDYVAQNIATKTPAELRIEMDRLGISPEDVARATGVSAADVATQYAAAVPKTQAELIAKAAADQELAARTAQDTTASAATIAAAQQQAATSQGLLTDEVNRQAAAKAAADLAAAQAAAAAKAAADKAAADAAAAKAAGDTAALKAAQDAAAKAAADKAAADAAAAKAAANAKAAADKAAADAAAKAAANAAAKSTGLTYALTHGMTQQQYYQNILNFYKNNSGLSDSMLRSEMDRLGISPQDVAAATGTNLADVLARYNNAKATTQAELDAQAKAQADLAARQSQWADQQKANEAAWAAQQAKNAADWAAQQKLTQNAQNAYANAPMTLGQKFGSYESIPIGAQYNPAVTPGGVSPYSMVMGQMTPFQNPYASFVPGTPLGGYDPNLYNQIAVNNANAAAAKAAAETKAANDALLMSGSAGGADGSSAGIGSGGNSGGGEGNGATAGEAGAGYAQGGMVNSLLGPNPAGPDDGMATLDRGEYVIKKSAVNKYGRGLLDMINEGKMPAKKIKSLLD
jgi:hypothetical protein